MKFRLNKIAVVLLPYLLSTSAIAGEVFYDIPKETYEQNLQETLAVNSLVQEFAQHVYELNDYAIAENCQEGDSSDIRLIRCSITVFPAIKQKLQDSAKQLKVQINETLKKRAEFIALLQSVETRNPELVSLRKHTETHTQFTNIVFDTINMMIMFNLNEGLSQHLINALGNTTKTLDNFYKILRLETDSVYESVLVTE